MSKKYDVSKKFKDRRGKVYDESEITYKDVDDPGTQFRGYVTKESVRKTNCIDDWVEVIEVERGNRW